MVKFWFALCLLPEVLEFTSPSAPTPKCIVLSFELQQRLLMVGELCDPVITTQFEWKLCVHNLKKKYN